MALSALAGTVLSITAATRASAAASGMRSSDMRMLTWALLRQMEQHLESTLSSASRVFYDQGSERMTHPCAPLKLRSAMHAALQQRHVEPLRSVIHPMR